MATRALITLSLLALLSGCSAARPPAAAALSQQQAHILAERLATAAYGRFFGDAAFQHSRPPQLVSGQWSWLWRRGSGQGDIEIGVTFAQDGSSPVVDYQCLGSAVYIPR